MKTDWTGYFKASRKTRLSLPPSFGVLCLYFAMVAGAGCATHPISDTVLGTGFKPSNVHLGTETLPGDLRRVLVLPLGMGDDSFDMDAVSGTLSSVVRTELMKTRQFEFVFASAETLRSRTGKTAWRTTDTLPLRFLETLGNAYGAEAVLFCEITRFRAYQPLTMGWKFSLVTCREGRIIWAADEVFDAGQTPVANAARRYFQSHSPAEAGDSKMILKSPLYFGQYSAAAVLDTMPRRRIIAAETKDFSDSAETIGKSSRYRTGNQPARKS
jgi:hypothetical protein